MRGKVNGESFNGLGKSKFIFINHIFHKLRDSHVIVCDSCNCGMIKHF